MASVDLKNPATGDPHPDPTGTTKPAGLDWYWSRLRAMSGPEIASRIATTVRAGVWRRRSTWAAPRPRTMPTAWRLPQLDTYTTHQQQQITQTAERYLAGQYTFLNIPTNETEPDWHTDPQTARTAPLEFGPTMNTRDPKLVGNLRNTWEKNRHHHLVILALAYRITQDQRFADACGNQLRSWIAANPIPLGVNWASPLEMGIRLISWVWVERLIQGSPEHCRLFGRGGELWPAVYWQQWFIAQHHSKGSSANNHLIGEMAGLMIASLVWPVFEHSSTWEATARESLTNEIERQTFPSGLNREQAFGYHLFALEFFLLAAAEAARANRPLPLAYSNNLAKQIAAIPPLMDTAGNLPNFGDSDDGTVLPIWHATGDRTDWLLDIGKRYLATDDQNRAPNNRPLASLLVMPTPEQAPGAAAPTDHPDTHTDAPASTAFEDAGIYVLTSHRNTPREIYCLADAGPLGFLSIAAHGHADAASFTLNVAGQPVFIDPGTYTYHNQPNRRAYFRSTAAHNTITIDDADQSVAAGPFLWARKAKTDVLEWTPRQDGARLVAEHDGYTRLTGRPVHRRSIDLTNDNLTIHDHIKGSGQHQITCPLHMAPHCQPELQDTTCLVRFPGGVLRVTLDPKLHWEILRATDRAGWDSPNFNQLVPAATLLGTAKHALPLKIATAIEISHED